jgi:hypothetical protein
VVVVELKDVHIGAHHAGRPLFGRLLVNAARLYYYDADGLMNGVTSIDAARLYYYDADGLMNGVTSIDR